MRPVCLYERGTGASATPHTVHAPKILLQHKKTLDSDVT